MKKILAVLVAIMLVLSMGVTVFAATPDMSQNTYKAYKIFTGTQSATSAELANIQWGGGVNSTNFLTALRNETSFGGAFASCTTAKSVSDVVKNWADKSTQAKTFARLAYDNKEGSGVSVTTSTTLDPGYYLIVDVTSFSSSATGTVRNLALLQLTQKGNLDIATKVDIPVVQKKVKDTNDSVADSTTDWQDSADHDMGDNVPFQFKATLGTISDYKTYKVIFHDTECAGFDAPTDFVVKITNGTSTPIVLTESQYAVATTDAGFDVTINDVIALGALDNAVITVEYLEILNTDASLGSAGNPTDVYLEYSNNPNGTTPSSETGKTVKDLVDVYTYKISADKIDESKQPLKGAGFTLYKYDAEDDDWGIVGAEVKGTDLTTFTWEGVDDGNYKLVETTVPGGYNAMDDLEFTVAADHDVLSDAPALNELTGGDVFTGDAGTGVLTGTITNYKGSTLPETGGIGTTIFYIVGGILLVGALILLITKKRANANKQ